MLKKAIVLSLILLLTGAAMFGWVLAERRKEKQLLRKQLERLNVESAKLDELIAGEIDVYSFSKVVLGEDWRQELDKCEARGKTRVLVLNGSTVCTFMGGAIFTWCLLLWTARLIIKGLTMTNLASFFANVFRHLRKTKDKQPTKTYAKEDEKASEQRRQLDEQQSQLEKHSEVLTNSGWQDFDGSYANRHRQAPAQAGPLVSNKPRLKQSVKDAEKIVVLLPDENCVESEESLKATTAITENLNVDITQPSCLRQSVPKTAFSDSHDDSLKVRTDNLEKQVAEFRQMTQTVQQTTREHSKPLEDGLRELTQQVSAIREYAAQQQDRMEKLQDGYDWNIIRTFCLRVIRCIDNLENRISQLSELDIKTIDLEEVRDELIFALESSGVEQFEPGTNSDYHGQEKKTEVIKDREYSDDPNMTGKIAEVIRPGYQYFIDGENVKVVRVAQVKLYN